MEHTFDELSKKTVAQLREIADGLDHDKVHGYKSLHKPDLVKLLCAALAIEAHEHHNVVGLDKAKIKAQIAVLKENAPPRSKHMTQPSSNELGSISSA